MSHSTGTSITTRLLQPRFQMLPLCSGLEPESPQGHRVATVCGCWPGVHAAGLLVLSKAMQEGCLRKAKGNDLEAAPCNYPSVKCSTRSTAEFALIDRGKLRLPECMPS
eukprot:5240089-Amphidinium_carterae.1